MSTVFLHVGQCGNQIGREFWSKCKNEADHDLNTKHAFWTPGGPGRDKNGHARGVFVDSEKKVLQGLLAHSNKLKKTGSGLQLGHGNLISSATGCGSNWALGYQWLSKSKIVNPWPVDMHSFSHELDYGEDDCMLKGTMEAVRREVESCDSFSGFVSCHSLGGGTGSGFGSRLAVELRDRYRVAYQMNVVVAPHRSGDSPVQSYNEVLALSSLQRNSDAIILFDNDTILNSLYSSTSTKSVAVTYTHMNSHIADCMTALFRPVSSLTPPNGVTVGIEPWELLRSVAPMSNLKLLQCRTVSEKTTDMSSSITWDKLSSQLCQRMRTQSLKTYSGPEPSSIAAVCVCRNVNSANKSAVGQLDIARLAGKIKGCTRFVHWNPFPIDVWTDERKATGPKTPPSGKRSMTLCHNYSGLATDHCARVLHSAQLKFKAKAYLHWYERYCVQESDFETAFEDVKGLIEDYVAATAP